MIMVKTTVMMMMMTMMTSMTTMMTKIMMMNDGGDDDGILQISGWGTAFQGSFCTRGFTEGATISSIRGIVIMTMVMPAMMKTVMIYIL